MNFEPATAVVLGLGTSGEAAARLLWHEGAKVTVLDSAESDALVEKAHKLNRLGIKTILGRSAERVKLSSELVVLSPGIDPQVELVQNFKRQGARFTGELELAYRFCRKPIVAITGTNGKTTTTQLIEMMLNDAGVRTIACGNIGMPFSEAIARQSTIDFFTVEVSSFQLETIAQFRPQVAVWLNFTPDHLDRYANLQEYRLAKLRIFERQGEKDFAIVNAQDSLPPLPAQQISFSAYTASADFVCRGNMIYFRDEPVLALAETQLSGVHNCENLMAALGVARALGLTWDAATIGLRRYRLLPHRCEIVGEVNGVTFINDSKATNLDALVKALESALNPVVLIAGGKDKGFEFDSIVGLVRRQVKYAVLLGEMADRIAKTWSSDVPCRIAQTLSEAVMIARRHAQSGDTVLFSPGTSSFDMFKNYADRGNQFRQLVKELTR
ncbi:MAG TPA: UDP-N-acetylmuramoyl-L-alanine--D-glutamate ligase [Chthoniobacterales bacterium]|nr:UDP-N-acetylmuramoyl-L-alanine--D-glutamate ligase [Chthoniobacterales bacterium]